nr:unnamed protein product [Callosobruchus chinensis]
MQGDSKHPKAPLGNNFRPPQPLHHRPVRTNIDFNVKHRSDELDSRFSLQKEVIIASAVLHNIAIDTNEPEPFSDLNIAVEFNGNEINVGNEQWEHLHLREGFLIYFMNLSVIPHRNY